MTEERYCTNCAAKLRVEASFCGSCGTPTLSTSDVKCPQCGTDNPYDARFCDNCRQPLENSEESVTPAEIGISTASSTSPNKYGPKPTDCYPDKFAAGITEDYGGGVNSPELPMVSFIDAIKMGFQKYFKFSGRSTRAEFWWWFLFITITGGVVSISVTLYISSLTSSAANAVLAVSGIIIWFTRLVSSLAIVVRRLHDINRTGWWLLLFSVGNFLEFVPGLLFGSVGPYYRSSIWYLIYLLMSLILVIVIIVYACKRGDKGPNKYGPDPRQATSQQS